MDPTEIELVNGARAWPESQAAFSGVVDPKAPRYAVTAGWYGTDADDNEGAFALVLAGSALEDAVGDILRVDYEQRTAYVFVVGAVNNLPNDLALARRAFMALEVLSEQEISVVAQAVLPE